MKALLVTACGCSRMIDIPEPLPGIYYVELASEQSYATYDLGALPTTKLVERNQRAFRFQATRSIDLTPGPLAIFTEILRT